MDHIATLPEMAAQIGVTNIAIRGLRFVAVLKDGSTRDLTDSDCEFLDVKSSREAEREREMGLKWDIDHGMYGKVDSDL